MATSLRIHIIATLICSCVIVALLIAAVATPSWVEASITSDISGVAWTNEVNYGLFSGRITGMRSMEVTGDLTMSCDMAENICIMSCQDTEEKRQEELNNFENGVGKIDCPFAGSNNTCVNGCEGFINAGLWFSSIFFLVLGLLGAVLAGLFAVFNVTKNPVEPILGVPGLYVWNGAGAFSIFLTLVLWGALFGGSLLDNIGYTETISGRFQSHDVSLGVSYWLVLVAFFVFLINVGILALRAFQLAREPPPPTIKMEENTDGAIFLY